MSRTVRLSKQALDFSGTLAPEPRRALKRALADLRHDLGDIRPLEGTLAGYYRLRIGRIRVIFEYRSSEEIEAIFIQDRSIVYEIFEAEFVKKLKENRPES